MLLPRPRPDLAGALSDQERATIATADDDTVLLVMMDLADQSARFAWESDPTSHYYGLHVVVEDIDLWSAEARVQLEAWRERISDVLLGLIRKRYGEPEPGTMYRWGYPSDD